jgi:hypothetical protein
MLPHDNPRKILLEKQWIDVDGNSATRARTMARQPSGRAWKAIAGRAVKRPKKS